MDEHRKTTTVLAPDDTDPNNIRASRRKLEESKIFTFDQSLWSVDSNDSHYAGQSMLHECLGTDFVQHALQGYNCCIFACEIDQMVTHLSYSLTRWPDRGR